MKAARDKQFCAAHGGGRRCTHPDCKKAAVGGSFFCTSHGGGKKCSIPGCEKSAQSPTLYCVRHGGGKTCKREGCRKVLDLGIFIISEFYRLHVDVLNFVLVMVVVRIAVFRNAPMSQSPITSSVANIVDN